MSAGRPNGNDAATAILKLIDSPHFYPAGTSVGDIDADHSGVRIPVSVSLKSVTAIGRSFRAMCGNRLEEGRHDDRRAQVSSLPACPPARLPACPRNSAPKASPNMLRKPLGTFIKTLLSAEADAVCGAQYRAGTPDRVNRRNGDRHRDFDTRAGTLDRDPEAS